MKHLKILIGEDNDYKFNILSYYLKETGHHEIIRVKESSAFTQFLCTETPDLVILGNDLPIVSGSLESNWLEVLRWMNGHYRGKGYAVPVILHPSLHAVRMLEEISNKGSLMVELYPHIIDVIVFDPNVEKNKFIDIIKRVDPLVIRKHQTRPKVAKFEKVPLEEFIKEMSKTFSPDVFPSNQLKEMWENIRLPQRATHDSAGYDFFAPFSFTLAPGSSIKIPTGIRAVFTNPDWGLFIYPRSGIGFKTGIRLTNTVGIIDADYFTAENTGHILIKLDYPANPAVPTFLQKFGKALGINRKDIEISVKKAFAQGVFLPYGITIDDDDYEKENRCGGIGSSDSIRPPHHHHPHPPKPDYGCNHPGHHHKPIKSIPEFNKMELNKLASENRLEYFIDRKDIIIGAVKEGDFEHLKSEYNVLNTVKHQKRDNDPFGSGFVWGELAPDEATISKLEYIFEFPQDGNGEYIIEMIYQYTDIGHNKLENLPREIKSTYDYFSPKISEDYFSMKNRPHKFLKNNGIQLSAAVKIKPEYCEPVGFGIPGWNPECMELIQILIFDNPCVDNV